MVVLPTGWSLEVKRTVGHQKALYKFRCALFYNKYVGFFENSSIGPRSIYVSAGLHGTTGPKLGDETPKKGAKILPPKNIDPFFRLEI